MARKEVTISSSLTGLHLASVSLCVCLITYVRGRGFHAGFLELEEIDGADYGIFGSIGEDVGASKRKVGDAQKKKKTKRGKRKRGDDAKHLGGDDDDGDCAGHLVDESKDEEEGEKADKKGKRKKRKVNDEEKDSESKEDGTNDNVEGA